MNAQGKRKWLAAFVLLCCLLPAQALAKDVVLENRTTKTVAVAINYLHSGAKDWVCQGWWTIDGLKKKKISLPTDNNVIYFTAASGTLRWTGKAPGEPISLPVVNGKFLYKTKTEKPSGKGYKVETFKMHKLSSDGKFTLIFND